MTIGELRKGLSRAMVWHQETTGVQKEVQGTTMDRLAVCNHIQLQIRSLVHHLTGRDQIQGMDSRLGRRANQCNRALVDRMTLETIEVKRIDEMGHEDQATSRRHRSHSLVLGNEDMKISRSTNLSERGVDDKSKRIGKIVVFAKEFGFVQIFIALALAQGRYNQSRSH